MSDPTRTPPVAAAGRDRSARRAGALSGVLAAGTALAAAQVAAAVLARPVSPVVVVGGAVVDLTPRWLKEFAIETFGESDKAVLLGGILLALALLAAAVGALSVSRPAAGLAGVALLGVAGAAAALTRPAGAVLDAVPSLVGALAGAGALAVLLRSIRARRAHHAGRDAVADVDRRRFLAAASAVAVGSAVAGGAGSAVLTRRLDTAASRAGVRLPAPTSPAPGDPAAGALRVAGLSPFFTPNADFYRVDTALVVPQVPAETWRLRVHGMVERELDLDFAALLARPLVERDVTLTCVSNEVGGRYAGTARWLGAPLRDLLAEAGVDPAADQLVSRSADGMTIGTPVTTVMDGRDALLAVGMNGEPLPPEHGFPVRMVVPGLYGYVSACKWLVDLELTTFDAYDAYWVERGWAARAPVRTAARIDTPRPLRTIRPGTVPVAGVAWAQHRGIQAVEVRVDGGEWRQARLSAPASKDVWRQWLWEWPARPGRHTLQVRATDGTGQVQSGRRRPPFPSGATGWHSVVVTVG